jgi:hypothetical protein
VLALGTSCMMLVCAEMAGARSFLQRAAPYRRARARSRRAWLRLLACRAVAAACCCRQQQSSILPALLGLGFRQQRP